jgi:uncharacterized protein
MFGPDFKRAKSGWLYPAETMQWPLRAILFFVLLLAMSFATQGAGAFGAYKLLYGGSFGDFLTSSSSGSADTMKSSIIGLMPSAIFVVAGALYFSRFGLPQRQGRLPLDVPKLGALGWIVLVLGFTVFMIAVFNGTFALLGIDPEAYSPSGGLNDTRSASGLVEKTMAELSGNPFLFALALPGVILAAPLTEELIFRGALFSAIASSSLGRIGAVVITSALWALMHLMAAPWLFVGIIFVMGLVLGMLLLRFGSLWVTIVCHTAWNTISSLAIFGLSAQS